MKVVDIATALAPDLPHEMVGIRPGEKLYEVLVTEDDSVSTVELSDRYVIEPAIRLWDWKPPASNGSKPVGEGFRYASNTNEDWLDADSLRELMVHMEK